eukprot:3700483-Pyramimonas_sp.AAC.1
MSGRLKSSLNMTQLGRRRIMKRRKNGSILEKYGVAISSSIGLAAKTSFQCAAINDNFSLGDELAPPACRTADN